MTAPMIFAADRSHWAGLVCFRGMRTRSSVQQGLSLIRTLAAWRSGSCPPSLQPCNQVPIRCRPWAPRPHTVPFLPTRRCSNASAWAHVGEEREELEHEGPEQEQEQQELEQEQEQEQEDAATGADENGSSSSKQAKCTTTLVDYLSLTDKELLAQCVVDTFRASGPGGQHRNKTDSAVRLKHSPTGLGGQASDERSQHVNKLLALDRLRQSIASKVRRPVDLANYAPPPELLIILPPASTVKKEHGLKQQIGPKNKSYVLGMQALLDLLYAANGSVSETAVPLGLSTGMLSKLITSDKTLWVAANAIRAEKGLKPLR